MKLKLRDVSQKDKIIVVSKTDSVQVIVDAVEKIMCIPPEAQRLFHRGKMLDASQTVFDYSMSEMDVIQVTKKVVIQPAALKEESDTEEEIDDEFAIKSVYFKIGDPVCFRCDSGEWDEGTLVSVHETPVEELSDEDLDNLTYTIESEHHSAGIRTFNLKLNCLKVGAFKTLEFSELEIGMTVLANINFEKPKKPGAWYETVLTEVKKSRTSGIVKGTVLFGGDPSLDRTDVNIAYFHDLKEMFPLSKHEDRDPTKFNVTLEEPCYACMGDPQKKCKVCCCKVCGGKNDTENQILCEECQNAYHTTCLDPQLDAIPEDDWFCPGCKRNNNEIVAPGTALKKSKKKAQMPSAKFEKEGKRDWGKGNATAGVAKKCAIVPKNHIGKIPGVDVGTWWKTRVAVSGSGVHRPPVAGIHGRETDCAYSIVLGDGYEDDKDDGDTFKYTGSGGRELKEGNRRTNCQSSDQTLTKTNLALAKNCAAPVNNKKGAKATDWKKGIPVRVVRGYKLAKHSEYAPKEGQRYDGLYKVVEYFPVRGKSKFTVWQYILRRDDPQPAPWTKAGQKFIKERCLDIIKDEDEGGDENEGASKKGKKRKNTDGETGGPSPKIRKPIAHELDSKVSKLIKEDKEHAQLWNNCIAALENGKPKFYEALEANFVCGICTEFVNEPVTMPECHHTMCKACLISSTKKGNTCCPFCRTEIPKSFKTDKNLKAILDILLKDE